LKQVTVVGRINGTQEKLFNAIRKVEDYPSFDSSSRKIKIIRRDNANRFKFWSEREISVVHFQIVAGMVCTPYSLIHQTPLSGDIHTADWIWELTPINETQTALTYIFYADYRDTSRLLKLLVESEPTLEHGINMTSGLIMVNTMKEHIEGKR
jgi:ribosome-associated toxin RatA of RatAB toxin-antitoxin module